MKTPGRCHIAGAITMPERSKLRLGPTIVIGVLTVLACVAIGFIYIGGDPGATTTIIGYAAMGLGLLAAILLGVGVALLIHHDRHSD
jgi:hypothetical protein